METQISFRGLSANPLRLVLLLCVFSLNAELAIAFDRGPVRERETEEEVATRPLYRREEAPRQRPSWLSWFRKRPTGQSAQVCGTDGVVQTRGLSGSRWYTRSVSGGYSTSDGVSFGRLNGDIDVGLLAKIEAAGRRRVDARVGRDTSSAPSTDVRCAYHVSRVMQQVVPGFPRMDRVKDLVDAMVKGTYGVKFRYFNPKEEGTPPPGAIPFVNYETKVPASLLGRAYENTRNWIKSTSFYSTVEKLIGRGLTHREGDEGMSHIGIVSRNTGSIYNNSQAAGGRMVEKNERQDSWVHSPAMTYLVPMKQGDYAYAYSKGLTLAQRVDAVKRYFAQGVKTLFKALARVLGPSEAHADETNLAAQVLETLRKSSFAKKLESSERKLIPLFAAQKGEHVFFLAKAQYLVGGEVDGGAYAIYSIRLGAGQKVIDLIKITEDQALNVEQSFGVKIPSDVYAQTFKAYQKFEKEQIEREEG